MPLIAHWVGLRGRQTRHNRRKSLAGRGMVASLRDTRNLEGGIAPRQVKRGCIHVLASQERLGLVEETIPSCYRLLRYQWPIENLQLSPLHMLLLRVGG